MFLVKPTVPFTRRRELRPTRRNSNLHPYSLQCGRKIMTVVKRGSPHTAQMCEAKSVLQPSGVINPETIQRAKKERGNQTTWRSKNKSKGENQEKKNGKKLASGRIYFGGVGGTVGIGEGGKKWDESLVCFWLFLRTEKAIAYLADLFLKDSLHSSPSRERLKG